MTTVSVFYRLVQTSHVVVLFIGCGPPSVTVEASNNTVCHKSQEGDNGVHHIVPENAVKHCMEFITGWYVEIEKECRPPTAKSEDEIEQTSQQALHAFRRLSIDEFKP